MGSADLESQPTKTKGKQMHIKSIVTYLIFTINSTPIFNLPSYFKLNINDISYKVHI